MVHAAVQVVVDLVVQVAVGGGLDARAIQAGGHVDGVAVPVWCYCVD